MANVSYLDLAIHMIVISGVVHIPVFCNYVSTFVSVILFLKLFCCSLGSQSLDVY